MFPSGLLSLLIMFFIGEAWKEKKFLRLFAQEWHHLHQFAILVWKEQT